MARVVLSTLPLNLAKIEPGTHTLSQPLNLSRFHHDTVSQSSSGETWNGCFRNCDNGQISGNVLVYRNPGMHFGDIHVLKATYVKALESFIGNAKFAIFFPCKGPRFLGDEIAGGDFDGDMYWVSRNPQLLEYFKKSEPWTPSSSMHNVPYHDVPIKKPSDLSCKELEEELFKLFLTTRF